MTSRKIEISKGVYDCLCEITSEEETFDNTINFLIDYYLENEDFSDEDGEYYNKQIEK